MGAKQNDRNRASRFTLARASTSGSGEFPRAVRKTGSGRTETLVRPWTSCAGFRRYVQLAGCGRV